MRRPNPNSADRDAVTVSAILAATAAATVVQPGTYITPLGVGTDTP
jgi:hypothetical protein